jgi:hydrogenase expression/formation protein HypC
MCLGIPAKIESIEGQEAKVNLSGNILRISTSLIDNLKKGDYVLVHAGFALQKIDEKEAKKTLDLLKELGMVEDSS